MAPGDPVVCNFSKTIIQFNFATPQNVKTTNRKEFKTEYYNVVIHQFIRKPDPSMVYILPSGRETFARLLQDGKFCSVLIDQLHRQCLSLKPIGRVHTFFSVEYIWIYSYHKWGQLRTRELFMFEHLYVLSGKTN